MSSLKKQIRTLISIRSRFLEARDLSNRARQKRNIQFEQEQVNLHDMYEISFYKCPDIGGHSGGCFIIDRATGQIAGEIDYELEGKDRFKNYSISNAEWDGYTLMINGIVFISHSECEDEDERGQKVLI